MEVIILEISLLDNKLTDNLGKFLSVYLVNPYATYGVTQDRFVNYTLSELSYIISKNGFVFVAQEDNEIVGLISLKKSEWDSNHFGIDISKIEHILASGSYLESLYIKKRLISTVLARCCKELLLHITVRVNKEDLSSIHALESKCFKLMDILVTYTLDLREHPGTSFNGKYQVRRFKPDEISELQRMAFDCFEDTTGATDRFHADPVLPRAKSSDLYAKWLVNSSTDPLSEVLVADVDGKPVGFNVCNVNNSLLKFLGLRFGIMVLTAVAPSARNKLVGTSLLNASIAWLTDKVDVIETGGQVSNFAIQRAWNAVGLKISRSQCTFHWSVLAESL